MKLKRRKLLSVIVPAYKAEKFIAKNLSEVKSVLDDSPYSYELICVVDGHVDKTYEKALKVSKVSPRLVKVYGYKENLGKGHAVRFGMARSRGDIIAFIDAGIELNPDGLSMLLSHFEWYGADIVIGSKRHQASKVVYPWQRKILSAIYQTIVRVLFGLKVRDTQVGMKFFKREVLEKTTPRLLVKAFAFDIEILAVAHYLGFTKIYEAPVELKMNFDGTSTIANKGFIKTAFLMLWDTLAVFYRLRILNFYHYSNRKSWISLPDLTLEKKHA